MDPNNAFFEKKWEELSRDVLSGMTDWRAQHPRATFDEIEAALDERLRAARAELLQEMASRSPATDWEAANEADAPRCPDCGCILSKRGKHRRRLQTEGNQTVELERAYGSCPDCGRSFFPPG